MVKIRVREFCYPEEIPAFQRVGRRIFTSSVSDLIYPWFTFLLLGTFKIRLIFQSVFVGHKMRIYPLYFSKRKCLVQPRSIYNLRRNVLCGTRLKHHKNYICWLWGALCNNPQTVTLLILFTLWPSAGGMKPSEPGVIPRRTPSCWDWTWTYSDLLGERLLGHCVAIYHARTTWRQRSLCCNTCHQQRAYRRRKTNSVSKVISILNCISHKMAWKEQRARDARMHCRWGDLMHIIHSTENPT